MQSGMSLLVVREITLRRPAHVTAKHAATEHNKNFSPCDADHMFRAWKRLLIVRPAIHLASASPQDPKKTCATAGANLMIGRGFCNTVEPCCRLVAKTDDLHLDASAAMFRLGPTPRVK
jgi:hypothetical protein